MSSRPVIRSKSTPAAALGQQGKGGSAPHAPAAKSGDFTNKELVLLVLFRLGGTAKPVHTEDIAHAVFQVPIGRQRYRWQRFADYPDKERIARELRRLKGARGRPLVRGNVNVGARHDRLDGWMLTAAGVDFAKAVERTKGEALRKPGGAFFALDAVAFRRQVIASKCYQTFHTDPSLRTAKDYMFTDMLHCLPDAPVEIIRQSFDTYLAQAKATENSDLIEFLEVAQGRFRTLLGE